MQIFKNMDSLLAGAIKKLRKELIMKLTDSEGNLTLSAYCLIAIVGGAIGGVIGLIFLG